MGKFTDEELMKIKKCVELNDWKVVCWEGHEGDLEWWIDLLSCNFSKEWSADDFLIECGKIMEKSDVKIKDFEDVFLS